MEKSKKNYIEKIMAAKAMENMTGRKEKLSEFERKKAQKELQKLSELLKINGGLLCFPENRF